jgi:hypothetical protein
MKRWRNVAINARGDLVSRRHIHSVGPTDRREGGPFPRKLEVTPNAAAALTLLLQKEAEAGEKTCSVLRNPAV